MQRKSRKYIIRVTRRNESNLGTEAAFRQYVEEFCRTHADDFLVIPASTNSSITETFRLGPPMRILILARARPIDKQIFKKALIDGHAAGDPHIEEIEVSRVVNAARGGRISLEGAYP